MEIISRQCLIGSVPVQMIDPEVQSLETALAAFSPAVIALRIKLVTLPAPALAESQLPSQTLLVNVKESVSDERAIG